MRIIHKETLTELLDKCDKAYVMGSDPSQFDLLVRLIKNLNDEKICGTDCTIKKVICSYGLSKEQHLQLLEMDSLLEIEDVEMGDPKRKMWFKKPWSILTANAKKLIWLDNDVEVKENIDHLFDLIPEDGFTMMARDWYIQTHRNQEPHYNSGVIVTNKSHIIRRWADECVDTNERGDQEVLYEMIKDDKDLQAMISDLPYEYNYQRLMIARKVKCSRPFIIHWTGPTGKKYIRENLL